MFSDLITSLCGILVILGIIVPPSYKNIETEVIIKAIFREYNPDYGDGKLCKCGHSYYRHFDSYEGMAPVGCKYCQCNEFVSAED